MGLWLVVDAVCVPLHGDPRLAPLQVKVRAPLEADGPPVGEKSAATCRVILPLPDGVVRAS
jgi:hypothetical protein